MKPAQIIGWKRQQRHRRGSPAVLFGNAALRQFSSSFRFLRPLVGMPCVHNEPACFTPRVFPTLPRAETPAADCRALSFSVPYFCENYAERRQRMGTAANILVRSGLQQKPRKVGTVYLSVEARSQVLRRLVHVPHVTLLRGQDARQVHLRTQAEATKEARRRGGVQNQDWVNPAPPANDNNHKEQISEQRVDVRPPLALAPATLKNVPLPCAPTTDSALRRPMPHVGRNAA